MSRLIVGLRITLIGIAISLCLQTYLSDANILTDFLKDDWDATSARNLRAECRALFAKANSAQNQMFIMENEDNVNGYEQWLDKMRKYDRKLAECSAKYEEVRDYLESKIWKNELRIEGFQKRCEKGTLASFFDHITMKQRY